MVRLITGLLIATGCHLLLFVVPVYHQPEETPQLLQTNAITVRFNPLKPVPTQKEAQVIPPPETITPSEKRVEKPQPLKPQPAIPKPKPKPRKVKKKTITAVKPLKPTPPPEPKVLQEETVDALKPKLSEDITTETQSLKDDLPSTTPKTVSRTPVVNKAPPILRKAYPKNEGNPPPNYPTLARRRGWEGTVQLSVLVLENGRVGNISVAKSSGHPILDEAALKAVARYQFVPGLQGNKTVSMRVQVPVHFRLQSSN